MIPGINTGNFFKPSNQTMQSTVTGGSQAGQDAGQWGLDEYKKMISGGPRAYGGPMPGSQGPNVAQNKQYNILTGMSSSIPNAIGSAVGPMTPEQVAASNRRGGPHAGYRNPYEEQVMAGLKKDYEDSLAMGLGRIGAGARNLSAFGGGTTDASGGDRHRVEDERMALGAQQNFLNQAANLRQRGFDDQMRYQREDATDNLNRAIAMNQGNLGFGRLRKDVAGADIANQFNLADRFGSYGLNQQGQQNMADMYGYNEFQRQENWKPEMLTNYLAGVNQTPWQTSQTSTQTGRGPSMFDKTLGLGITAAGLYGGLGGRPFAPKTTV